MWSKGKTIQSAQYLTDLLSFCFTSINSSDTAILKFYLEKSKVKVTGEVKGQGHIVHPVSNRSTSFLFHTNRTNHSWDMSNRVFDHEKTHPKFQRKKAKKRVSNRIPPTPDQVMTMTREIYLPNFAVIGWVVLTLSWRQANFCLSMSQPRPWVKVTQRSSSTFSQTYIFFVPNT